VRIAVFLIVSTAFGNDGFDFRDAVLDCFFVGYIDTLALDFALGHALTHKLCEQITGKHRWSFAGVSKLVTVMNLELGIAYAWRWPLQELD